MADPTGSGPLGSARLPARTAQAEEAFIRDLRGATDLDPEDLAELVSLAMADKRVKLGARLVQLLPDFVEIEPGSALERAERAARLLVLDSSDIELYNCFDEAWREVRRRRMKRMLARQRLSGRNEQYTVPRVGRRPRKR